MKAEEKYFPVIIMLHRVVLPSVDAVCLYARTMAVDYKQTVGLHTCCP